MRSILFDIPLRSSIDLGPLGAVPVFGFGLLLSFWLLLGLVWGWLQFRRSENREFDQSTIVVWLVIAGAIIWAPAKESLPIYGFGTMLFLSYVVSSSLGAYRLRRRGLPGDIAWDVAIWIFLTGLIGGRIFYIIQYRATMFPAGLSLTQILFKVVNLPDGGLVLYGGLIFAPFFFWLFCRHKGLRPLPLADLLIPLVFVGLMFGRVGCLMHGCCYGDYCELPWAITFPQDSAPYNVLVVRGYLPDDHSALRSLPLHPTQIYDAVNALAIAGTTWTFYPFRRRDGEVVALAAILYAINRYLIELLRWDEPGQFGFEWTISQFVSAGVLASGIAFMVWLYFQSPQRLSLTAKLSSDHPSPHPIA